MRIVIMVFSIPFIFRIFLYMYHLMMVKRFMNEKIECNTKCDKASMLVLIPVLREQSVIQNTINHFVNMKIDNINLYLIIAGTKRETRGEKASTLEVVDNWIAEYKHKLPDNIVVDYCEAGDEGGDRATQLNYAVNYVKEKKKFSKLDYIGVYDADSLPSDLSLQEVVWRFQTDSHLGACQQPVHFIKSANQMARNNENPLLVANALYQTTWTAISELPMWIKYSKHGLDKPSKRHLYLIGHGEFLTENTYNDFHFPEYEITDGIQLGYRLGMSNIKVSPLHEFCNDDVPHNVSALVKQHKRWFGGCMNFISSYKWAKDTYKTTAVYQVIDGYWSQIRWAWTAIAYLCLLVLSAFCDVRLLLGYIILGVIYCYAIPVLAHKMMKTKIQVRFYDWLCLPMAIGLKSLGPNIYILNKIFRRNIKYEKVER